MVLVEVSGVLKQIGVQSNQGGHGFRGAAAKTALGGNAKVVEVAACSCNAIHRTGHTIDVVDQAQIISVPDLSANCCSGR